MTKRKKWVQLSTPQKVASVVVGLVQYSLLAAALWDIWHRPEEEINGTRRMWTMVAFLNFVGPLAYFVMGRKRPAA